MNGSLSLYLYIHISSRNQAFFATAGAEVRSLTLPNDLALLYPYDAAAQCDKTDSLDFCTQLALIQPIDLNRPPLQILLVKVVPYRAGSSVSLNS